MRKIPLDSTIFGAYRFLFTNLVSIIGTMWLPVAVLLAILGALVWTFVPHAWFCGDFSHADIKQLILTLLPLFILCEFVLVVGIILTKAMIQVGILRHSTGLKTSTTLVYFSLGSRVWRMVVVQLFGGVVAAGLVLAIVLAFVFVHLLLGAIPNLPSYVVTLCNLALVLAAIAAFVYVMLRMFFFLPAVVVTDNKIGVARAWELGKGNVLRMIVVIIATYLPIHFAAGIVTYLTVILTVVTEALRQQPDSADKAMAFLKSLWPVLPAIGIIQLVALIAVTGVILGAMGLSYQAVTAPEETSA